MLEISSAQSPWFRFAWGFALTMLLSGALMRWLAPRGWMDLPDGRHRHHHPTPRTGGLALAGMLLLGQALGQVRLPLSGVEWFLVYFMAALGALDDRFNLRARWKALAGLAVALVLAFLAQGVLRQAGPRLPLFGWQLASGTGLALALLWAWYWAIPQACNLIDGLNGLALGFFMLLAMAMDLPLGPEARGATLLGGMGALLLLNWPMGAQFLGDSGSLMLGALFAVLGVKLLGRANPNHLLCAFAYPIVDVLMVMAVRAANRRPLGEGDCNHFHHQWQRITGRDWAALILTLGPGAACMQILGGYPGHRLVAWAGLLWLAAAASWFYYRSGPALRARGAAAPRREPVPLALISRAAAASGEHMGTVRQDSENS